MIKKIVHGCKVYFIQNSLIFVQSLDFQLVYQITYIYGVLYGISIHVYIMQAIISL